MDVVIQIPGYNSDQGENTLDLLTPMFKKDGIEVIDIDYPGAQSGPLTSLFKTTSAQNEAVARCIVDVIIRQSDPVVIVAHSNGVAITSYVVEILIDRGYLRKIKKVILIHGALKKGYCWPVPVINLWGKDSVLTWGANSRRMLSKSRCAIKRMTGRKCTGSRWGAYGSVQDYISPYCRNVETPPGHSELFKESIWLNTIVNLVT